MKDLPTVLELDRARLNGTFKRLFNRVHDLTKLKEPKRILSKLERIFKNDSECSMIYFVGMSQNNGNWLFDENDRGKVISFMDILKTWKRKAKC